MPDSNIEKYLKKLRGDDTNLPYAPQSNVEAYLAKMAGQDVELPSEPESRVEALLAKWSGEDVDIPFTPESRVERYLADKAGMSVKVPPEPLSRVEELLDDIVNSSPHDETVPIFYIVGYSRQRSGARYHVITTVYFDIDAFCERTGFDKNADGISVLVSARSGVNSGLGGVQINFSSDKIGTAKYNFSSQGAHRYVYARVRVTRNDLIIGEMYHSINGKYFTEDPKTQEDLDSKTDYLSYSDIGDEGILYDTTVNPTSW